MKKQTLQKIAYDKIREMILAGAFAPGQEMRESVLAQQINSSVTPVREALRKLELEGWIDVYPYRGAFLHRFTEEEQLEISIIRRSLESCGIELFVLRANESDLDAIRRNLEKMEILMREIQSGSVIKEEQRSFWRLLDYEFHQLLIAGAHSERLMREMTKCQLMLQQAYCYSKNRADSEDCWQEEIAPKILKQHQAIFFALEMACKNAGSQEWLTATRQLICAHIPRPGKNQNENTF